MVAKKAWIPAKGTYSVGASHDPFNPTDGDLSFGSLSPNEIDFEKSDEKSHAVQSEELLEDNTDLEEFLNVAALANLANVHQSHNGEWNARGDPTEIAIQVFAARFNWNRTRWTSGKSPVWEQLAEFPFDSDVKKMSVIFEDSRSGDCHVFTKGAVERVIASCTSVRVEEGEDPVEVTENFRQEVLENMEALTALGLRVLALASRTFHGSASASTGLDRTEVEEGLTFQGLIGLYDPPRPESAASVRQCHEAGISVHM